MRISKFRGPVLPRSSVYLQYRANSWRSVYLDGVVGLHIICPACFKPLVKKFPSNCAGQGGSRLIKLYVSRLRDGGIERMTTSDRSGTVVSSIIGYWVRPFRFKHA